MPRILLAVDGSECALRAPRKLIETIAVYRDAPDVDLVTVHLPVPRVPNMGLLVSEEMIQRYYEEECTKDLRATRALFDAAGIAYSVHSLVGPIAESIAMQASRSKADFIYLGTHGRGAVSSAFFGSVVMGLLHRRPCPVVVVP
ncbi:MAG TPA: universal stress protein [Casimicrobiaceae bacterium]|nr:universal stress protein [Casimicrobiaceae bacterium]